MMKLYCRKKHKSKRGDLCEDCTPLLCYAHERADSCRQIEHKTACGRCSTPCYKPDMREQMRVVMRFSGLRMMLHHPVEALRYMLKL